MKRIKYRKYYVYEDGSVENISTGRVLATGNTPTSKYRNVNMRYNGVKDRWNVHRLVATLFIPNPNKLPIVNHLDGNILNNHYSNLEWTTQKGNLKHCYDNGGTPIRNFTEVDLYRDGENIGSFKSKSEACKRAKELGGRYHSLMKYLSDKKGFSLKERCNDYPEGE